MLTYKNKKMKKILFSLQVFLLIVAFPLYFFAELNHGAVKPTPEKSREDKSKVLAEKKKARSYVIFKMPAAPEYQVQLIND